MKPPTVDSQVPIHDPNLVWLPTNPPRPAPFLLTGEEVMLMLRTKSKRTLKHYVGTGELKARRFGRELRYRLSDVVAFINAKVDA